MSCTAFAFQAEGAQLAPSGDRLVEVGIKNGGLE